MSVLKYKDGNTYKRVAIADGPVGTARLVDAAVTAAKIADGSVNFNKLSGNLQTPIKVVATTGPSATVSKSSTGTFSIPVDNQTGYTPVGIVGLTVSGSNASYFRLYGYYINASGEARIFVRNDTTNNVNAAYTAYVLYVRNEFFVEPEP